MEHIFDTLKRKYPSIKEIDVFSDGAASQFKQRFLFSNLHKLQDDFELDELRWHYFATSHGKGIVDGLGGTVKRSVWREIRSGRCYARTAFDFFEIADNRCPGVSVTYISKEEIALSVNENRWEMCLQIPNTHATHFVKPDGSSHLLVSDYSSAETFTTVRIIDSLHDSMDSLDTSSPLEETRLNSGDWVVVNFEGNLFPGEVVEVTNSQVVVVNVMHKSGNGWKWPKRQDVISYDIAEVVKTTEPPVPSGSRGQFQIDI